MTENISNTAGFSSDPQIAVAGNHVYVVWTDFTPGNWDIFFRTSNDNGATFGEVINISNNAGESGRVRIAVSDDNVYVVWADSTSGNWDILLRTSNDNGATFGEVINISNNAGDSSNPKRSDLPQIAVSDNHVYVVWADSTSGNWDILLRTSNDNGATFSDAINLSDDAGESGRVQIAVSANNVYVVWADHIPEDHIFLRTSNDNGSTFGNTTNLSDNASDSANQKRSDLPRIAVYANNVYVVWADYLFGDYDIFFRASNDNGATFSDAVGVETTTGLADLPHVAVSGNNVHVLWHDYTLAEGLSTFLRTSPDNGATFGKAINLSRNVGYSASAPIVVSDNNVYVVSAIGNIDIFFRASGDNGATFSDAINLSNNIQASSDPQMVVSGSNVHVVWEDHATENPEILFRSFIPSTQVQTPQRMLFSTDNGSLNVEVTMDRGTLEAGLPVGFTLKFLDPMTEEILPHVNYSFKATDENGNIVVDRLEMHAHNGIDTQSVTFPHMGSFTLTIEVTGVGLEEPYDPGYNGIASTALTVVPEFPLGVLAVMGAVVGTAIAITRFRGQLA